MALSGSGSAYYRTGSAIPAANGLHSANTMHCFVKSSVAASQSNFRALFELVGSGQNPHEQNNWSHPNASFYKARAHRDSGGSYTPAQITSTPSTGVWHSWASSTASVVKMYFNGTLETTSGGVGVSVANDPYLDLLALMTFAGALDGASQFVEGEIAEVGVWNVALSDDEIASLSKGFKATLIRPQSLKLYAPLVRTLIDRVGGRTLVKQAGSDAYSDHPRVFG